MTEPAFLACDWGTTNLRAWLSTAEGAPLESRDFAGLGVSRLSPGEAAKRFADEVRPAFKAQNLPAVLCGMIGSDLGWRPAGYLPCPANAEELAAALVTVEDGANPVWIAPGLKGDGVANAPDVMRGEETQVFGFLHADPARLKGRHLIMHPGTHAKWIVVEDGRIVRFTTAMTGELFHVLRTHSVLKGDQPPKDEAAFDAGLVAAVDGSGLAARLFSTRARVVAGGADPESSGAYLSGVLVGSEVASIPGLLGWDAKDEITLLGDATLSRWYGRALAHAGYSYEWHDGEAAALSGLAALYRAGAKL